MTRRICVITGSRADYGLLKLVMRGIQEDSHLTLQVIATGMHLSPTFGLTYKEIEADGFEIDARVDSLSQSDTPFAIADATSKTISGCAKAFEILKPDLVLVLGDRFEIFAACVAALLSKIPLAHIHGGEVTVGAYDEALRHSITKMSNIHFVATKTYGRRVIQLGENPSRVHIVGGLGVDAAKKLKLLSKKDIADSLDIDFKARSLLVTFHPETLEELSPENQIRGILEALSELSDTTIIFTLPNSDTGGLSIIDMITDFVKDRDNAYAFKSLGQLYYLSCLAIVDGVVGNSSSGILEAPSFRVGTVNIGERQKGRERASSVIDCGFSATEIQDAIRRLFSVDFKLRLQTCESPFGTGGASENILRILRSYQTQGILKKEFHDLSFTCEVGIE